MSDSHADIDAWVRRYMIVFGALLVLTVVTVAIYYLHLGPVASIALALFVATLKGSLVAGVFMHLIDEKKAIYWIMASTVGLFIVLLALPALTSVWGGIVSDWEGWRAPAEIVGEADADHH